ncbi:lipoate--protein ligase family protein [Gracilibacillus alcaliphilus]|uniref:lipoate--protein ligase family protein n=1 Tax=Gracilibacillus alcaliphilus TaxID=1401441 RepID=UPI0019579D6C|nr:biotin/lipoate A/B protein ligase family protein [Gracilibacillus alcaliphilus]MBM7678212.1 lipoate-protein ligase A [Gracilibacillus alcaliphilus]
MTETWYFLDTHKQTPAYNMAVDECLLQWHSEGKIPPVLRFYEWLPAGLSIGYFQKTKNKIDLEAVKKNGFQLVRRLTGGRAVLHDQELTYSIIVSEQHPRMPKSVKEAYLVLSQGLLEGFRNLGIAADFAIPEDKLATTQSAVCFEEPSWYELVVDNKKAAGSAQTRKQGVILQHGSIPLSVDNDTLYDLFVYRNEQVKQRARAAYDDKAIDIDKAAGRNVSLEETKQAFKAGFEQGLAIQLETFKLSDEQEQAVNELMHSKYLTDEWNYSR